MYLATGSVERAIQWMMWGYTIGSPRFWQPNQPRMVMSYPSGDAIVELIPESAKLNINTASPDDLLRVVATVTGNLERSREIVAAIIDWRSPCARVHDLRPVLFDHLSDFSCPPRVF